MLRRHTLGVNRQGRTWLGQMSTEHPLPARSCATRISVWRSTPSPPRSSASSPRSARPTGSASTTTRSSRIRLLPENNARQGFPDAKQVMAICRHLSLDLADAVQLMFITGWRSRGAPAAVVARGFRRRLRAAWAWHEEEHGRPCFPIDPRPARAARASACAHTALRARPGADHRARVPPRWETHQVPASRLADGQQGRRATGASPS